MSTVWATDLTVAAAIATFVVSLVVGIIGLLTYNSQKRSEGLQQTAAKLQQAMADVDLRYRKQRARTALAMLISGIHRQANWVQGWGSSLSDKMDLLEPIRPLMPEVAWLPPCAWKDEFLKFAASIGPSDGANRIGLQVTTLTNTRRDLGEGGRLYKECEAAIDTMT